MHQKYSAWAKMFQEFNCGVEKLFDRLETLVLEKNKNKKARGCFSKKYEPRLNASEGIALAR